ncbi:hypothetical protein C7T94_10820 [Pedobacter yulinensis]|uniref:Uncharacterized protein n=1 Tax=Pedobacter yulinensis TaxID=2126353 RepID=A0A2T3HL07_9SPHI|nr:hypothetical protein [Pedobacter yulinensis]PST83099.1 hypothetical protein C7T94_10820 [Pedobacter yulinensis]
MKRCYALICAAGDDVNPQHQAYLYDRICFFEGRPQRYGTQFGDRGLYPVEDWEVMVRLREELGLSAHDEKLITESKYPGDAINLHSHDEVFCQWRKKVGWI